jgi:hypothetical protein
VWHPPENIDPSVGGAGEQSCSDSTAVDADPVFAQIAPHPSDHHHQRRQQRHNADLSSPSVEERLHDCLETISEGNSGIPRGTEDKGRFLDGPVSAATTAD